MLTLLFILIVEYSGQTVILQAPATITYFLFILLSTLRLNFWLSVFTGVLAAIEFVAVSVYYCTIYGNQPLGQFVNMTLISYELLKYAHRKGIAVVVAHGIANRELVKILKNQGWEIAKTEKMGMETFR